MTWNYGYSASDVKDAYGEIQSILIVYCSSLSLSKYLMLAFKLFNKITL